MTKTWLITGSSRGFGRELAKAVLDNGIGSSPPPAARSSSTTWEASAVQSAEQASEARAAEARRWAAVSRSADFAARGGVVELDKTHVDS
jgi:NAD(P)-dependent dehydrogenase (short-subunit alcohol dehydrogenase family)